MRIGMMLRTLDEKGGIAVYTENLIPELLKLDRRNQYILFYNNPAHLGRFAGHPNVTERLVKAPHKAWWDQISIPYACWQEKVDVVFHPKFTVPLLAPCKAVMVVHGADWFIPEQAQFYHPLDVRYIRTVMPLYFQKSSIVISVSQLTTDNFYEALNLPPGKVKTIYFGPARHFKRVTDQATLERARARYNLPDNFILTLTKRQGDGRKNLGQIFKAYARYHTQATCPHRLVIGGKDCHLFRTEYGVPEDGYGRDILFPGWIDQADLPAVYSLAGLYLYPSNLEAFPIPITEAMACGTPIVTSNANGLREIAGDAALLVDPGDPVAISEAMGRVLSDGELWARLSGKGLARSTKFAWDTCAQLTLETLESLQGERG
ncbi:MAG: glycosyltransferase family 1 protein [Anaerolineae bacterium]|nr:glycosyltransferase family 1 protein [Anaerolineae bacterium]